MPQKAPIEGARSNSLRLEFSLLTSPDLYMELIQVLGRQSIACGLQGGLAHMSVSWIGQA